MEKTFDGTLKVKVSADTVHGVVQKIKIQAPLFQVDRDDMDKYLAARSIDLTGFAGGRMVVKAESFRLKKNSTKATKEGYFLVSDFEGPLVGNTSRNLDSVLGNEIEWHLFYDGDEEALFAEANDLDEEDPEEE